MNVFCFFDVCAQPGSDNGGEMLRSQAKDVATVLGLEIYGLWGVHERS